MGAAFKCPCITRHTGPDAQYPSNRRSRCRKFLCSGCKRWRPWCCGGTSDQRCDTCVKETS